MAIYDNTSTLYDLLNKINNLSKTDVNLLENKLIERTDTVLEINDITTIGQSAFIGYTTLQSVNFPQCITIGDHAFQGCSRLTTVNFPECTNIGYNAFLMCTKLTTLSFPSCETIGSNAFHYCSNVTTLSFPSCETIGSNAFLDCLNLTNLYLTNSYICTLLNSNAFKSTSITSTTGSIFVPASLVASYKTATNWTYFSNRIFGQGDS